MTLKSLTINKIIYIDSSKAQGSHQSGTGEHKSQRLGRYVANTVFLRWYGNYKYKLITSVVPYTRSVTIPLFMTEGLSRFLCPLKDCGKLMATVGGCVTFFSGELADNLLACVPANNILMFMKKLYLNSLS